MITRIPKAVVVARVGMDESGDGREGVVESRVWV